MLIHSLTVGGAYRKADIQFCVSLTNICCETSVWQTFHFEWMAVIVSVYKHFHAINVTDFLQRGVLICFLSHWEENWTTYKICAFGNVYFSAVVLIIQKLFSSLVRKLCNALWNGVFLLLSATYFQRANLHFHLSVYWCEQTNCMHATWKKKKKILTKFSYQTFALVWSWHLLVCTKKSVALMVCECLCRFSI